MDWPEQIPCPYADDALRRAFRRGAREGARMMSTGWDWADGALACRRLSECELAAPLSPPEEEARLQDLVGSGEVESTDDALRAYRHGFCEAFCRVYCWVA